MAKTRRGMRLVAMVLALVVVASGCSALEVKMWFQIRGVAITDAQAIDVANKVNAQRPVAQCDPNYEGFCVPDNQTAVRCAGTPGAGPEVGPVRVVGWDHFGLSPTGNGLACVPGPPPVLPHPPGPVPTPTTTVPDDPWAVPPFATAPEIALPTYDVDYDRVRNRVLLSVENSDVSWGNRFAEMNPLTGEVGRSILVPGGPGAIAVAADSSRAYVAVRQVQTVLEVNLATFTVTRQIDLSQAPSSGADFSTLPAPFAVDIVAHPTRAETIAVSRSFVPDGSRPAGVVIFDSGIARPMTTPIDVSPTRLAWGDRPDRLYGHRTSGSSALFELTVSNAGVTSRATGQFVGGADPNLVYANGHLFTNDGQVFAVSDYSRPIFYARGSVDRVPATGRAFIFNNQPTDGARLAEFEGAGGIGTVRRTLQNFPARELVGAGAYPVAANSSTVVLLNPGATRAGFQRPAAVKSLLTGATVTASVRHGGALAATPDGSRLYQVGGIGSSSLIEIDASNGVELRRVELGRSFSRLAMSSDGSVLLLGDSQRRDLVQVSTASMASAATLMLDIELATSAIVAVPGTGSSFLVSASSPYMGVNRSEVIRVDNGVRASNVASFDSASGPLVVGSDPSTAAVLQSSGGVTSMTTLAVTTAGVSVGSTRLLYATADEASRATNDNSRLFTGNGLVVNYRSGVLMGRTERGAHVLMTSHGRVFTFGANSTITEWDSTGLYKIASRRIDGLDSLVSGGSVLAGSTLVGATSDGHLVLIRLDA